MLDFDGMASRGLMGDCLSETRSRLYPEKVPVRREYMSLLDRSMELTMQGSSTHGSLLFLLPFKNVMDTSRARIFPSLILFCCNDSFMSCSGRGVISIVTTTTIQELALGGTLYFRA